ncbi:MAG: accessory Sec system translocase SecA2 [Micromonosporaceae bacterium]|nr:accessory Sec system translocase SecA2 [Micromonosporaceae bacterium]
MSLSLRLKARFRRFLERPGTTVDLAPLSAQLPAVEARGEELTSLDDDELTEAATEAAGPIEISAIGREAAHRALGERAYDEQVLGVMSLLAGHVSEMATGEGKTLVACIAGYGHVRRGNGPVHVLTINDYLARRDAEWMAPVYRLLGMSVGWVTENSTREERREAYAKDVTYVSVSEAGFDYLRDQLVTDVADRVKPQLVTAIVDEADSILIDEARVPLVLAGSVTTELDPLHAATALVRELRPDVDYEVADDGRSVALTPQGTVTVEKAQGDIDLYADEYATQLFAVNVALHAHALVQRDVDYIVRNGAVELVDEFRGRVAQRRRWPDGLQAAVEAKEGLDATAEGEVLGTITIQSYLKLYPHVCGMTATAVLVGDQLREFFDLEVAVIPRHKPVIRTDEPDRLYASREERDEALVAEISACHAEGRPVLVGTQDVKESEALAVALRAVDVSCVVLNAKNDAEEAAIIAEAGTHEAVTVSTQMAGRGVDIRLGGSDQADWDRVADLDGLYVIGSGRHDSRRVDDQLRGRAGRQGDPGGSVFFVSLEDDLVVRHAADMIPSSPRIHADGLIDDSDVDYAVEHAQRVAEGVNFEIHRNTWRYHVVVEQQRQDLATWREELLTTDAALTLVDERLPAHLAEVEAKAAAEADAEAEAEAEAETETEADAEAEADAKAEAETEAEEAEPDPETDTDPEAEADELEEPEEPEESDESDESDEERELRARIARSIALFHLDRGWAEHLATLAEVREGVHLRALGRLDPLDEFHRAAVPAFTQLRDKIERRIVETYAEADISEDWQPADVNLLRPSATWTYLVHDNPFGSELERLVSSVSRRLGSRRR